MRRVQNSEMLSHLRLVVLALACAAAQAASPADAVLARMDRGAAQFHGMTAQVQHISFTAVISDSSTESGSVKWRKLGANQIQALLDYTTPNHKLFLFKDHRLQIYTPSSNTVQVYDLSQHSGQIEQFLMIGFGTPRSEMERAYKITVRDHPVIKGRPATLMEMVPRSPEALKLIARLDLWIPDDSDYPVQEKAFEPSGDTETWIYTNIKINPTPPLTDSDLKLDLPKNVQTIYPQK